MKAINSIKSISAGVACALASLTATGHEIQSYNLDQSIQDAGLVFKGTVASVENRVSAVASDDHVRLPHTFVTYKVDEVLKGEYDDDTITLRFIGGQDPETGDYLTVEGVPSFNQDESDILFIGSHNGESMCPLQGCEKGRFRVVDDNLYSQHGEQIFLSETGVIKYGELAPEEDLKRIWTHELPAELVGGMSTTERQMHLNNELPLPNMHKEHDQPESEDAEVGNEGAAEGLGILSKLKPVLDKIKIKPGPEKDVDDLKIKPLGKRIKSLELVDLVRAKVERDRLDTSLAPKKAEPIKSADPDQGFFISMPKPVKPEAMAVNLKPIFTTPTTKLKLNQAFKLNTANTVVNTEDAEEEEMIRRQGGNPVIK